jgi:thiamine-monophosphate kinase
MESKHTSVASIGEFQLIDRLVGRLGLGGDSDVVVGIGDDAAVLRQAGELLELVTVDALIEGVHFERSLTPLRHLGFKVISVNVSDVCAMNAVFERAATDTACKSSAATQRAPTNCRFRSAFSER